jgi:hypothetical protein
VCTAYVYLLQRVCKSWVNVQVRTWFCDRRSVGQFLLVSGPFSLTRSAAVVRIPGYRSRAPRFDSQHYQIFWEVVGLERGPLSLVMSTTEELLGRENSGSGLENLEYGRTPRIYIPQEQGSHWACLINLHITEWYIYSSYVYNTYFFFIK